MAEVRASSGVPAVAAFGGVGAPSFCPPLVVDSATGTIYSLTSANVVVAAGTGSSGTVTSVGQTFTGGLISVGGSPITTSGTLALTVAGTSGGVPYFSGAATWASSGVLAASALMVGGGAGAAPATVTTGTGVITALGVNTGSAGAVVLFNGAGGTPSSMTATNLTGTAAGLTAGTVTTNANLTGEVTSVGNAATLTNSAVIGKVLTGYVSGAGTVAATDTILQAIQKLNGNDATNANLTGPITSVGNATAVAAQTGTGSTFVMQASPTLTTPNLGTPTAATLTNATGLPIATGVSGLGTGVATALAVNVGTAGAFVVNGGVLGSPSSAGTIPAFTLGGTISGGGNQINNVIIGTSTPLAGFFTTLNATGAATLQSTLAVANDLAVNTNKFTVAAATGNTLVAGTLNVTGSVAVNTNKFTVDQGTGDVTVAGTLAITGATTLSAALTYGGVALTNAVTGTGKMVLDTSPVLVTPALGTPSSGTLTNCTFPTLNQNTSGSAGSLLSTATTGLMTITGPGAGTTRVKTIRNANDTLLELGGSYTPTGTWTSLTMVTPVLGTPASGNGTNITNVNAAQLGGATFASPTAIGSGTPAAVTGTTLTASTGDISATAGFVTLAADGKGFKSTYSTGTVADSATATLTLASGCGILLLRESNTTGAWALYGCSVDLAAMVKISSGGAGIAWTVTKDTASSVNVYQGAGGGGTGNVIVQNKTGSNKAFKACWLLAV